MCITDNMTNEIQQYFVYFLIYFITQLLKPTSQQEMNELVMGMLRAVCEEQQKTHTHIGESGSASESPSSVSFKFGLMYGKNICVSNKKKYVKL